MERITTNDTDLSEIYKEINTLNNYIENVDLRVDLLYYLNQMRFDKNTSLFYVNDSPNLVNVPLAYNTVYFININQDDTKNINVYGEDSHEIKIIFKNQLIFIIVL